MWSTSRRWPMAKTGVDDFLAAGGTVEDLIKVSRPFDPADFATVRMSRGDKLRAGVEDLRHRWRGHEWRTQGDYTVRAIVRVLIRRAEKQGKLTGSGIRVKCSRRTLALEAAISARGVTRAIPRAEAFILLTEGAQRCPHNGKGTPAQGAEREKSFSVTRSDRRGDTSARPADAAVPELRWSTVLAHRERDKRGRWVRKYEYLARLGKKRQAVLEYLVEAGGVSTVAELMELCASARTRPRDFRRRTLAMLTEAPAIVVIEGDVVSLAGKWWEALEHARVIAGEQEAARLQAEKYRRQSQAFRRRSQHRADPVPEMRPIPDLRKPWPVHPTGCACPPCVERFGTVEGEHVEGCNCAECFTARKEAAHESGHRGRAPSGVVPLPRQHRSRENPTRPAAVISMHSQAEPPELEHPWHCDCPSCGSGASYVRLRGNS
jgi:hypothetical protein